MGCKLEDMGVGRVEGEGGRVEGMGEDRVVGMVVVGSGVVVRGLSGQCGMGVGMEQVEVVEVVEVQDVCGGRRHERVIQWRRVEERAWVLEEDLVGWRGTRGGARCVQSDMVVGMELVGEEEGEVVLGGSDGGKGLTDYLLLLVEEEVEGEVGSILEVGAGEVEVVGSRLADKGSLMDIRIRISSHLRDDRKGRQLVVTNLT